MRRGSVGKRRRCCSFAQALVDVVGGATLLLERVARVLGGEIEQLALRAAGRREHVAALAAALAQPLGDAVGAVGEHRDEHLVGDDQRARARVAVVLAQERRDHLVVGDLDARIGEARHVDDAPRAHVQHRQLDQIALPVDAEHVLVQIRHGHDALRLAHQLHGLDLVAVDGGDLVVHVGGGIAHAILQLARQLVVTAVEEQTHRAHLARRTSRDRSRARTAPDSA